MHDELEPLPTPRAPRYAHCFAVELIHDGTRYEVMAENASTTGLLVTGAPALEEAATATLAFRLAPNLPRETLCARTVRCAGDDAKVALRFESPQERFSIQLLDLGLEPEGWQAQPDRTPSSAGTIRAAA